MDMFVILHNYRRTLFLANSFVACSVEFITVHTLTIQFNFYATLLALYHAQCYTVVFNINKNVLAYQLILLSFKP